jgi:hypothetical protein
VTRIFVVGLLAMVSLPFVGTSAHAQCGYPQFGCGGACLTIGSRFHQHGPLYSYANYGQPGTGYGYGYGGYGGHQHFPNRAPMSRGFVGGGLNLNLFHGGGLLHGRGGDCNSCGGSGYALSTFRNVLSRINPFQGRGHCSSGCGQSCSGGCSAGCK